MKNIFNNISNFTKLILNKESSPKEKCLYLLPALLSILYLTYEFFFDLHYSVSDFYYLYYGSVLIFIFNSILILFKNYSTSKKLNLASFPLFLIIFFWSYELLFHKGYDIKFLIMLIFQIYLFLNLYLDKKFNVLDGKFNILDGKFNILDKKFNILNIGAVSSLFNFYLNSKTKKIYFSLIFVLIFILSIFYFMKNNDGSNGYLLEGLTRPVPNTQGSYVTCVYETKDGKRFSKNLPDKFLNPCPRIYNYKTGEFSSF
jgi:hypothetical protein